MKDPVMKKAFDQWEDLSRDDQKWVEYETRKKAIHDELSAAREAEIRQQRAREEGLAKGREEGMVAGKAGIVRNMLAKGLSIPEVAEMTGLTLDEVERLKRHLH